MNERVYENSWIPLIVVTCASFIIILDRLFMNVSMSRLVVDLNTDVSTIQMIMSFYTLITAAFILPSTKLQDIVGKKKLFLIGVALFGLGTVISTISSGSVMFFIGWSAIEGIAGALMMPAIVSIISGTYSGKKRTIALAALGMVTAFADVVAPILGGVITTYLGWRFTFGFELIFIIFILVMQNQIPDFIPTESMKQLDIPGAFISVVGLVLLILGILTLNKDVSTSIIEITFGLIIMIIFVWYELNRKRSGKVPLVDIHLLKDKNLRIGVSVKLLYNIVVSGTIFVLSLFFQSVMQLTPFETGLATIPFCLGLLVFSTLAPRLIGKLNHKTLLAIGCIISIIGCLILSYQFKLNMAMWDYAIGLFILGSGLGFMMALTVDVALFDIPSKSQNNASGIVSTGDTLGSSMGTAIIGIILILGVMGGISTAVDTYAPAYSGDEHFHQEVYNNFQKLDTLEGQDPVVVNTANIIIQNAMGSVMYVLAVVLVAILILVLRIKDKSIKKS